MRTETSEVKTKGKVVGSVEVNIYETIDELVEAIDAKTILEFFNKSNKIAAQASERQKHTPGRIGKTVIRKAAFNLCTSEEIIATTQTDDPYVALEALVDSKMDEAKANLATAETAAA